MTPQLQHWEIDPFDIVVWKNLFDTNSNFNTIQQKINYPVDIYETENGLRLEESIRYKFKFQHNSTKNQLPS